MKIAFRVDASAQIGTGHVMRCLVLAEELKRRNVEVLFITRDHSGHLSQVIQNQGHKVILLPAAKEKLKLTDNDLPHAPWLAVAWKQDAEDTSKVLCDSIVDWLIVDHYAIDYRWHQVLRPLTKKIMVIDDLADRVLDCDILLDQNFYIDPLTRYDGLVPYGCSTLLAPRYMLLRKEFLKIEQRGVSSKSEVKKILVFMGGADLTNETVKVLKAIDNIKSFQIHVDVVIGGSNPYASIIKDMCHDREDVLFYQNVNNIAELCSNSDIAIGAGGVATLERCFCGLPSLVMLTADNQVETTLAMDKAGAIVCIGWHYDNDQNSILGHILNILDDKEKMMSLSRISRKIFGDQKFSGVSGLVDDMEGMIFESMNYGYIIHKRK